MSDQSTPQPEQGRQSGASGAEAPGQAERHAPAAQPGQAPPAGPEHQPQPTQPLQAEQPAQAPPVQQPEQPQAEQPAHQMPPPPPVAQPVAVAGRPPKVRRSSSDTTRLVVAAGVGAALLAIGGIGGYFVGAATHDHTDRPGMVRFGDGMRGPIPGRPGAPDRPGDIRELPVPQPR